MTILSVKCHTNSSKLILKSEFGKMQFLDQLATVSPNNAKKKKEKKK